jgi:hypothetical protein
MARRFRRSFSICSGVGSPAVPKFFTYPETSDVIPPSTSDGSGDTFVFTQYLAFSTQSWEDKPGYGTSIA